MIYNIAYAKDNIFQTGLIKSNHDIKMIYLFAKEIIKAEKVFDIKAARPDDMKPSKPIIEF